MYKKAHMSYGGLWMEENIMLTKHRKFLLSMLRSITCPEQADDVKKAFDMFGVQEKDYELKISLLLEAQGLFVDFYSKAYNNLTSEEKYMAELDAFLSRIQDLEKISELYN